ncbi:MAG: SRPBCC family protein [Solirubrobacterales bacterium]
MPSYEATVTTQLDADHTFGLLADFANAEDWDPATIASTRVDDDGGPVAVGSKFRLDMRIGGRDNTIVYEITEFAPPRRVVLRGENSGSVSIDEIVVKPTQNGHGAVVQYNAEVTLKGAYKLISPVFALAFKRMGDGARDAMHDWLDEQAAAARIAGG